MGRPSFRSQLIASGMQTVHERGFTTSGLREITAAAGVAQGSFTNHFSSKEEFGVAVLDHYFERVKEVLAETLRDDGRKPKARLAAYFDTMTELFAARGWRHGCMAGNMALEASEHSEMIRQRLGQIFAEWTPPFALVIREGQLTGDFRTDLDPEEAAAALMESWHGAMLRMKIDRSSAPLIRFRQVILPAVLAAPERR
jgi:TetR/AcrR family transcriptional repressor of nem operon